MPKKLTVNLPLQQHGWTWRNLLHSEVQCGKRPNTILYVYTDQLTMTDETGKEAFTNGRQNWYASGGRKDWGRRGTISELLNSYKALYCTQHRGYIRISNNYD